jgi:hypothetical protein
VKALKVNAHRRPIISEKLAQPGCTTVAVKAVDVPSQNACGVERLKCAAIV